MWMICLPDYGGNQHAIVGPFSNEGQAKDWARANVGSARTWFSALVQAPGEYKIKS